MAKAGVFWTPHFQGRQSKKTETMLLSKELWLSRGGHLSVRGPSLSKKGFREWNKLLRQVNSLVRQLYNICEMPTL